MCKLTHVFLQCIGISLTSWISEIIIIIIIIITNVLIIVIMYFLIEESAKILLFDSNVAC